MFGDYIFIQSDKVYKILFKKDIVPNFEKRLSEIKEFKSKLDNLPYNDLKLLKVDLESKSTNATDFGPFSVLIAALLGFIISEMRQASSWHLIFLILALIVVGFIITYFMRYRSKMIFTKEIIDICLEEKTIKN
jgi:di/tricarboxylate transporter